VQEWVARVSNSTRLRCAGALLAALLGACNPDVQLGTLAEGGGRSSAGAGGFSGNTPDLGSGAGRAGSPAGGAATGAGGQAGSSSVIWRSGLELSDLSEWTADGQGENYRSSEPSTPSVSSDHAHGGSQSLKVSITVANGMTSVNYMYRQAATPTEAYYSAWFLIPRSYTVKDWWNIVHFVGSQSGDGRNEVGLWDLDLRSAADGSLALYVWDFEHSKQFDPPTPHAFPIGVWVKIEVLFRKASDASGRFAVYQDGALLVDLTGVRTAPNDWLRWAVGSASANIVPSPAELYIDDAAISTTPVQP